jgi:hypothetical protein
MQSTDPDFESSVVKRGFILKHIGRPTEAITNICTVCFNMVKKEVSEAT